MELKILETTKVIMASKVINKKQMEVRHDMRYYIIMVDNTTHLGMDAKNFNVI